MSTSSAVETPLLSARGITKTYQLGRQQIPVLRGVDLDLMPGEIVALLGASGAGKSTLLHLLGLLDQPSGGEIRFRGEPVQTLAPARKAELRHRRIGFVFQFYHLIPELTALENVLLGQMMFRGPFEWLRLRRTIRAEAVALLERVGLGHRLRHRPAELSGGEKQRVAIARAILKRPAILVFDEATSALDSANERAIQAELAAIARERTALTIAHRLSTIVDADEILVLDAGRIVERGRHAALIAAGGAYARMWQLQQHEAEIEAERRDTGPADRPGTSGPEPVRVDAD